MAYENIIAVLKKRSEKNHVLEYYLEKYFSLAKIAHHSKTEDDIAVQNERIIRSLKH